MRPHRPEDQHATKLRRWVRGYVLCEARWVSFWVLVIRNAAAWPEAMNSKHSRALQIHELKMRNLLLYLLDCYLAPARLDSDRAKNDRKRCKSDPSWQRADWDHGPPGAPDIRDLRDLFGEHYEEGVISNWMQTLEAYGLVRRFDRNLHGNRTPGKKIWYTLDASALEFFERALVQ